MAKKVTGITKNGIEEECRWDKAGVCPRHTIHKGVPVAPVSLPEGLTDEYETSSPMSIFGEAESHILTTKEIREGYSLNEFGEPDSKYEAEFNDWLSEELAKAEAKREKEIITLLQKIDDEEDLCGISYAIACIKGENENG